MAQNDVAPEVSAPPAYDDPSSLRVVPQSHARGLVRRALTGSEQDRSAARQELAVLAESGALVENEGELVLAAIDEAHRAGVACAA